MMPSQRTSRGESVRIGPITLFTLIVVICLAVLVMLTYSTANASLVLAQRQAVATSELYLDETAAQEFVASMDEELAAARAGKSNVPAVQAVDESLKSLRAAAANAADGQVDVSAHMEESRVLAEFSCKNGRVLDIAITIRDDATYRIDKWRMAAVQNEAQPEGELWTGL